MLLLLLSFSSPRALILLVCWPVHPLLIPLLLLAAMYFLLLLLRHLLLAWAGFISRSASFMFVIFSDLSLRGSGFRF